MFCDGICLVHLVWAPLGPEPLGRFLDAYRRYDAGAPHALLILLNGFRAEDDLAPWRHQLSGLDHDELRLEQPALDLAAYRELTERVPSGRYCFLNSYSEPVVEGWLAKLDDALAQPGVGLVGATGSWASTRSSSAHVLGLPSAYRGVLPKRRAAAERFRAMEAESSGREPAPLARGDMMRVWVQTVRELPERTRLYERFPAYHVRTNAFMIFHATLAELQLSVIREKDDAYLLENGRRSITRQVQRKGLRTLVVDRDGALYDQRQWHRSRTFWQGDQEGLLVIDNQTRFYAEGDIDRRRLLSGFAWGHEADPALP